MTCPPPRLLTRDEVLTRLELYRKGKKSYMAMYSSLVDGIITDEVLMSVPLDEHMVHRGHAVFDTAAVENGYLYNADAHINRVLRSAEAAKIQHNFSKEWIKSILVAVARASGDKDLSLRYWITAGPGDFGFSPVGCIGPAFYCISFKTFHMPSDPRGIKEVTIPVSVVGMKPSPVGTLKSTNYLSNVLLHLAAKERGGNYGIWLGEDGFVKEGPINAVILVNKEGIVRTPPPTDILLSCTCHRALQFAEAHGYTVSQAPLTPQEIYDGKELFFVGGDLHFIAVTSLDGHTLGNGLPGPLWNLLQTEIPREAREGTHAAEKIL